jgi:hypothetical protein
VKLAAQVARDYGLSGPPSYTVEAERGTWGTAPYQLELGAEKANCFQGRVRGLAGLPGNLGCIIWGLHDNWSAWLQLQDGQRKTRFIPVEQGFGYAVLRAEDDGRRLFIGHPLIADNPDVVLSLARTKDWKSWQAEIHNPTDKPVTVKVQANPGVAGLQFNETLKLAAGSSVFRNLGAAE